MRDDLAVGPWADGDGRGGAIQRHAGVNVV